MRPELRKEIIEYCREVLQKMNLKYLEEHDVYRNEFLEYLFVNCIDNYKINGGYKMIDEDIASLFKLKQFNEGYMKKIKNKEVSIIGIDKFDNIVINEDEITYRTKAEGSKD